MLCVCERECVCTVFVCGRRAWAFSIWIIQRYSDNNNNNNINPVENDSVWCVSRGSVNVYDYRYNNMIRPLLYIYVSRVYKYIHIIIQTCRTYIRVCDLFISRRRTTDRIGSVIVRGGGLRGDASCAANGVYINTILLWYKYIYRSFYTLLVSYVYILCCTHFPIRTNGEKFRFPVSL